LALTLLVACCYAAITGVLLALMGASGLHERLGDAWYNTLLGGGGVWRVLLILVVGAALSACVATLVALRRRPRPPIAVFSVALVLLLIISGSVWAKLSLDPVTDRCFALLLDVRTEYAPGYSEEGFESVRVGLDESTVLKILGEPLHRWEIESGVVAFYSYGVGGASYWRRLIAYDLSGHVTEITVGLYGS